MTAAVVTGGARGIGHAIAACRSRAGGEPEDVARTVATLVRGGLAFATGEVIHVGGGLHLHRV
jgi:NAD(P)-dependent dehydrogenase (short-subunit alcohol dehydrogenase family)